MSPLTMVPDAFLKIFSAANVSFPEGAGLEAWHG